MQLFRKLCADVDQGALRYAMPPDGTIYSSIYGNEEPKENPGGLFLWTGSWPGLGRFSVRPCLPVTRRLLLFALGQCHVGLRRQL